MKESVSKFVKQSIEDKISNLEFPHGSINNSSISWGGFKLNASMITGEFDNLVSQKISTPEFDVNQDGVQVTHSLHSPDIVSENLNSTNLNAQEITVNNIKVSGQLTADNILGLNEKIQQFLGGDSLPTTVVNSNLKSVGQLHDLVVSGETLLGDSLYASSTGRIGINTDEPTSTLTLWDEETNLNIGKNKQHTIEIRSKSDVIIGSSTHDNIVLTQNGDTKINSPIINNTKFSTVSETPGFAGEKGDLAWNSNPAVGQPVGWVCLGGAVWSKFGIAE